jgi:muramidase (phage lysozyme)
MARAPVSSAAFLALAALAAFAFWPRESQAAEMPDDDSEPVSGEDDFVFYDDDMKQQNLRAALYMIQAAEHLAGVANTSTAYYTVYGNTRVSSLADHPAITREWVGKQLPDAMCAAAGFGPGCVSTAAGAYQIIKPTWQRVRKAGAWGPYLSDFSSANQDEAARRILIECRALPLIESGDIVGALPRMATQWASLPGSKAQQNPKAVETVLAYFENGLRVG